MIDSEQSNKLNGQRYQGSYNTALPALNVMYHLTDSWNLYANTEGSFGSVQYSQMPNRVSSGEVKPEKARTWEVGTRYDNGDLQAEIGAFLINFDNQYESNQTNDSVIARGETRHQGIETSVRYALDGLSPALAGFDVHATTPSSMPPSARTGRTRATRCRSRRATKAPWAWVTPRARGS
jgi:Fe(3+) dicitrate transport protein